ncbi:MAG: hypothetical protein JRC53_04730 [Deltaproteobacteria bacterium]|nr:hypothetical protein [Deltaproteobacteria bacterium]
MLIHLLQVCVHTCTNQRASGFWQVSLFLPKNVDVIPSYSAGGSVNARLVEVPVPPDLRQDIFFIPFIGSDMCHVEQNIPVKIIALLLRGDSYSRKIAKDSGIPHTTVLRKLRGSLQFLNT